MIKKLINQSYAPKWEQEEEKKMHRISIGIGKGTETALET
jgi:hypothetical protein